MIDDLMNPDPFPPQDPAPNARVAEYADEASARSRDVLRTWMPRRLAYGPDAAQKLDVFQRETSAGAPPRPAMIFCHGGAWVSGYLWWSSFMAPGIWEAGGVLVAPTYRLGPKYRFPAQLVDVAAAIAWVWTHADEIGVDRTRIFVGGHSAGGHLSALAALHPTALREAGASADIVKGCFAVSSSFNLHYPDAQPGSGEERVYKTFLAKPEDDRVASPINYVSAGAPPFHIVHGEQDFERIIRTSRAMAEAVSRQNGSVAIESWAGMDHFDTHLSLSDPANAWYGAVGRAFAGQTPD